MENDELIVPASLVMAHADAPFASNENSRSPDWMFPSRNLPLSHTIYMD